MARGFNGVDLGRLRTLFDEGAIGSLSDGELLGRFLDDRGDSGEAAFGALVHRHASLVFGVCRRTLGDAHQSEDAFQATFLLLARKARSIRDREAVGPWLVGVAVKVAARARGDAQRRRTHEGKAAGLSPGWFAPESVDRDEVADLLQEVDRLRRPLREAVVLCHLQGLSYDSAAEALGVTEGTIRGRLARARVQLRDRLDRRGLRRDLSASAPFVPRLLEIVPDRLIGPTVRASMALASGRLVPGIVPGPAVTLMEGVLKTMMLANWKTTALIALGVGLITLGATFGVQARQKPEAGKATEAAKGAEANGEGKDLAALVDGKIVRSAEVTKDCMVLSYIPDWAFGNVDNIGIGNNDGGVRTLVDWPDVPASEAKSADLKFYLAFYSRKTIANPKPGSILAFEITGEWPERTSWMTHPACEAEPILTAKFEPGDGWKVFDITTFVRERQGKSGHGLLFRFLSENRGGGNDVFSDYKLVSRESESVKKRPQMLVVEPTRK